MGVTMDENESDPEPERSLPEEPVRLLVDREDHHIGHLQVYSYDHVGLLFKICELLTGHGVDICSAIINTSDNGIVYNEFEVRIARPADTVGVMDWCRELEEMLEKTRGPAFDNSLVAVSKRLSVNPDLVSVVTFKEVQASSERELRYHLVLEGINQAGLLTYTALVLFRCGFSILHATISTSEGHIVDTFDLSTKSAEAESLLRSYLDVPNGGGGGSTGKETTPLPFHAIESDPDMQALMQMWKSNASGLALERSHTNLTSLSEAADFPSPGLSHVPSLGEIQEECSNHSERDDRLRACSFNSEEQPTPQEPEKEQEPGQTREHPEWAQDKAPKASARKMSVQFVNGDVYTGNCKQFPDGERRHGLGTYVYSSGTHDIYKQYHGQWHEDKKHGYGVLFYRNGGVYVGQWRNNQKHGLGVLLDTASQEPAGMPTYRYEGLWKEDQQHGLGAEEQDLVSYFGNFSAGQRSGLGIRMNLTKLGSNGGIEVMDSNNRALPFQDALLEELNALYQQTTELELQRKSSPIMAEGRAAANSVAPGGSTYHFSNSQDAAARTSLADLAFTSHSQPEAIPLQSGQSQATNESGSTSTASAKRSTPAMIPRNGSNNDLGETPSTPALQAGAATFCGGGFMGQRITSPSGTSMGQATPMQYGVVNGPVGSDRRSSSESGNTASFTETSGRRFSPSSPNGHVARKSTDSADGAFVFSMYEENDLISPQVSRIHGRTIPEEKQSSFDLDGGKVRNGSKEAAWEPGSAQSQTLPGGRRISEDPVAPLPPAASKASKRPQTIRKSPLLWTEDELAAFMGCLGLSTDICQRVMGRKIKGASQLLSMTDAQLRKYLGLVTPVERLVVRHALKRLLDAARWENNVCGHKGMDILSDSVLSHYIVPKEELTLVSRISQGGYGTVYRGVLEPKVDRAGGTFQARRTHLVAVKDMKGERRVQLYELLKEACVMASLSHPNICTFVGVSMDPEKKRHYIISELMDCSLFDMIHQPYKLRWHGELTVALSLSLGTGIISGICYIHQKNLVHADLKSSNILIDYTSSSRHPVPRICDFGHAAVRCHPSPHHRCGTPHWASPEVLRGEALGPAADIYSFGVMLWEMLTQKLPHKDMSFGQVLASVGWAGSTPDMAQLPELPKEVNRIIKECLRFAPSERPVGKDVLSRLKRFPKQVRVKTLRMLAGFLGYLGVSV